MSASQLAGERFVAFEQNIPTRRHIDRLLKAHGVKVNVVTEFDNTELLKRAVEINAGLSILPRDNVEREVARGDLAAVAFADASKWVRPLGILRRRGQGRRPGGAHLPVDPAGQELTGGRA